MTFKDYVFGVFIPLCVELIVGYLIYRRHKSHQPQIAKPSTLSDPRSLASRSTTIQRLLSPAEFRIDFPNLAPQAQATEEAEGAKLKAAEEAERAKLKATEEAERAKLKAAEEDARKVELQMLEARAAGIPCEIFPITGKVLGSGMEATIYDLENGKVVKIPNQYLKPTFDNVFDLAKKLRDIPPHLMSPKFEGLVYVKSLNSWGICYEKIDGLNLHKDNYLETLPKEERIIYLCQKMLPIVGLLDNLSKNGFRHNDVVERNIIRKNQDNSLVLIDCSFDRIDRDRNNDLMQFKTMFCSLMRIPPYTLINGQHYWEPRNPEHEEMIQFLSQEPFQRLALLLTNGRNTDWNEVIGAMELVASTPWAADPNNHG